MSGPINNTNMEDQCQNHMYDVPGRDLPLAAPGMVMTKHESIVIAHVQCQNPMYNVPGRDYLFAAAGMVMTKHESIIIAHVQCQNRINNVPNKQNIPLTTPKIKTQRIVIAQVHTSAPQINVFVSSTHLSQRQSKHTSHPCAPFA